MKNLSDTRALTKWLQRFAIRLDATEFPLTSMSRALAERISTTRPLTARARALDVGCGSGVHSYLMAEMGFKPVAFDRNQRAVHAARRHGKMPVAFLTATLDRIPLMPGTRFDLITFNPPGYYQVLPIPMMEHPLITGVYIDQSNLQDPRQSPLFRFLNHFLPLLEVGGRILCTWPALAIRLAPEASRPLEMLKAHVSAEISGPDISFDHFLDRTAEVGPEGYGLRGFWDQVREGIREGLYSPRTALQELASGPVFHFSFGILRLDRNSEGTFKWVWPA